jgi:hypothetical protein
MEKGFLEENSKAESETIKLTVKKLTNYVT